MFAKFFIKRPRFALVISLILCLAGFIALKSLPIALYPEITPPEVVVRASYPGASAEVIAKTVGIPLESSVNGVEDMLYMNSESADGTYMLTVTFQTGVDPDIAQVKVQNRVSQATPLLPTEVTRYGLSVFRRSSNMLGLVAFRDPSGKMSTLEISDYLNNNVQKNLSRISGIGEAQVFGAAKSMRVWLNSDKMAALHISIADVKAAIASQNYQPSLGKIGARPNDGTVLTVYALQTDGRLNEVEDFKNIIVRTDAQGGLVHLHEIANVEIGQESYSFSAAFDGSDSVPLMLNLASGANALETMKEVRAELKRLSAFFPDGLVYDFAVDTTEFINASIEEVEFTLLLTFILVVIVCYVFLQDWRATLVPAATIPVSLLGTFAVMMALGYSINMFTLFALVLAIGLVVDDAICVVERVIVLMNREKKSAFDAANQAMEELSSALIATTLVLLAIFIPITFMGGITGKIYTQFAVTISVAVCFSTLNALSLSPAICSTMLKPIPETTIFALRWFNMIVQRGARGYRSTVRRLARKVIIVLLFVGFIGLDFALISSRPTSFIPLEDQGIILLNVQLPEGATFDRTKQLIDQVAEEARQTPGVRHVTRLIGFSLMSGSGENVGIVFIDLEPWNKRKDPNVLVRLFKKWILRKPVVSKSQTAFAQRFMGQFARFPEATIFALELPSIPGLGTSSGLDVRIQSLNDFNYQKLESTVNMIAWKMMQSPYIDRPFPSFRADTPNLYLQVNRAKAESMKVPVSSIFSTLENYLGSSYVGDVNFGTQINKVILQSDSKYRMTPENINKMYVTSATGDLVPLMALVDLKNILSPRRISRYNQYPAAGINASPKAGASTGQAMAATEEIMKSLPPGYSYEWTGMSYQEKKNQGQIGALIILALIFAYLFLVAQYESWTIPVPVLMSVVAAIGGGLFGLWITGLSLSIYAQLGLVLLVGLAAKNAILIVEFAKDEHAHGTSIYLSAMDGLTQRFRPVLMTAFTFILGMVPMVVATGAGAASRRALGVPVFWGMLIGTMAGLCLIPLFYLLIQTYVEKFGRHKARVAARKAAAQQASWTENNK